MTHMRVLVLDGYGVLLGASGTSLEVRSKAGRRQVPLSEVDVVVVASGGVSVSSRAMRLMASAGVEMVVLGSNGLPVSVTYFSHYSRTPETRRAQYMAFLGEAGGALASSLVSCKLLAQANALRRLSVMSGAHVQAQTERLRRLAREVKQVSGRPDEVRPKLLELEAAGAREYWVCWPPCCPAT